MEINLSAFEEKIEEAYWEFDGRKNGYSPYKDHRKTERDSFKYVLRRLLVEFAQHDRGQISAEIVGPK